MRCPRMVAGLVMGLVVALIVAACGDDGGDEPTPAPTDTATATVDATPSPAGTATGTPQDATATPPAGTATATPTVETFAYTVVQGDTLFSLARRYGTTVEVLQALNGIDDPGQLRAGSVIRIPAGGTPGPTATAAPGATATATRPAGGPSLRVDHGTRATNKVALTFDMGGRVEPALDIMNWLIANRVQATIFMTGAMAENQWHDEGRQVLALVDANRDLFELGSHSYSHPDFRDLTDQQIRDEMRRTETAVARYTDMSMLPLFRPPFGGVDSRVLRVVGELGYTYTIMWDIDSGDWRPISDGGPTAQEMVNKVVTNAAGGTIVVMHLGGYETYPALPGMVAGLQQRGFELVKVSELLPE
jgi:peptidoglycan/xylan/chitin deacetylase (PgdA/CDA1 family)